MPPQLGDQLMAATMRNRWLSCSYLEKEALQIAFERVIEFPETATIIARYDSPILAGAECFVVRGDGAIFEFAVIDGLPDAVLLRAWVRYTVH